MSSAHPALRIWHAIWSRQKVFFSHGFLKELLVCIVLWLKVVVCCVQEAWSEPNYDSKKRDGYLQNIFRCFWRFYLVFFFFFVLLVLVFDVLICWWCFNCRTDYWDAYSCICAKYWSERICEYLLKFGIAYIRWLI
jgi:hypothetical protein